MFRPDRAKTCSYTDLMSASEQAISFYETHYDVLESWLLTPGNKVMLGDRANRRCRFCGKGRPEVTFKKVAHAIPEALGNKSIESAYECDPCNEKFGSGIENDLGNWSKPMRTLARIRGKSGVPTLKKGSNGGWRIEHGPKGFEISSYEDDPIYSVDEAAQKVTFTLKRDPYVPVAVLKAFVKIGLTLLPDSEVANFPHAMNWVQSLDHGREFASSFPIIYTFRPGPVPPDLIVAMILRRKAGIVGVPYCYLVLGYGNEVFQIQLPSEQHDSDMNGRAYTLRAFPVPDAPDPALYGAPKTGLLNLTGRDLVRGDTVDIGLGYEVGISIDRRTWRRKLRDFVLFMFRGIKQLFSSRRKS